MLLPSTMPSGPRPGLRRMVAYSQQDSMRSSERDVPQSPPRGIDGASTLLQSQLGTQTHGRSSHFTGRQRTLSGLRAGARVSKRPPPPPRPPLRNLRKRGLGQYTDGEDSEEEKALADHGYDMGSRGVTIEAEDIHNGAYPTEASENSQTEQVRRASTPKRTRRLPPSIPFGLNHDDFLDLDEGLDDKMAEEMSSTGTERFNELKIPFGPPIDEGYGSMELGADRVASFLGRGENQEQQHPQPRRPPVQKGFFEAFAGGDGRYLRPQTGSASEADPMSASTRPGSMTTGANGRGLSPSQLLSPDEKQQLAESENSSLPTLSIPRMSLTDTVMTTGTPSGTSQSDQSPYPFHMDTSASPEADYETNRNEGGTTEPILPALPLALDTSATTTIKLSTESFSTNRQRIQQPRPSRTRPSLADSAAYIAHSDPGLLTPCTPTNAQQDRLFQAGADAIDLETSFASTAALADYQHKEDDDLAASSAARPGTPPGQFSDDALWTDADDRALVALVVDKLRLKKSDWDACARALGVTGANGDISGGSRRRGGASNNNNSSSRAVSSRAGASLGRRWSELVSDGCIGLKFRYGGAVLAHKNRDGDRHRHNHRHQRSHRSTIPRRASSSIHDRTKIGNGNSNGNGNGNGNRIRSNSTATATAPSTHRTESVPAVGTFTGAAAEESMTAGAAAPASPASPIHQPAQRFASARAGRREDVRSVRWT